MVESGVYNIYVNDGTKEVSRFELIEIAIGDLNQTIDAKTIPTLPNALTWSIFILCLDNDNSARLSYIWFKYEVWQWLAISNSLLRADPHFTNSPGPSDYLLDNDFRAFQILVGKCDNSGSFGELALMYNMPRAATVQAATEADGGNGMLWAMDRCAQKLIQSKSRYS